MTSFLSCSEKKKCDIWHQTYRREHHNTCWGGPSKIWCHAQTPKSCESVLLAEGARSQISANRWHSTSVFRYKRQHSPKLPCFFLYSPFCILFLPNSTSMETLFRLAGVEMCTKDPLASSPAALSRVAHVKLSQLPPSPLCPLSDRSPPFVPRAASCHGFGSRSPRLTPLSTALDRAYNIRRLMPDENDKRETVSNVDPARARRVFQRRRSPILCARLPRSVTFSLGAD